MKLTKVVQTILIASTFIIPIVGNLTINNNTVFENENRSAFKYPNSDVKDYWDELQKALNDRLIGREYFQKLTSNNLFNVLSQTTDFLYQDAFGFPGRFVGWFFLGDRGDKNYQKHIRDLKRVDKNFDKNFALLKRFGEITKNTYLVVGPDKGSVYPEYMNPYIGYPGKYRYFNDIKQKLLQADIKVIDNQDAMVAAKDPTDKTALYYANDTHWNRKGALIAFHNTMKTVLGSSYTPLNYDFTWSKNKSGDLNKSAYISSLKEVLDENEIVITGSSEIYTKAIDGDHEVTATRNFGTVQNLVCGIDQITCNYEYIKSKVYKSKLKIALISDSFGGFFEPYLLDYFEQVLWCNAYDDHDNIVKYVADFKPDVILYLRLERNI
ncbi:MAG: hypothetical protein SPK55_10245 [Succinivibrio sp.]|nr:hypothetical protein [Succinivibrio sp.]